MSIHVTCPGCSRVFAVPDERAGTTVRCDYCQTEQVVPAAASPGADPPAEPRGQSQALLGLMDRVFEGMGQALSVWKLGFFLLAACAAVVACGLLVRIGFALGTGMGVLTLFLAQLAATGLSGVIAGGVAHQAVEEGQGRTCRLADAIRFCGEQFVALFFGALLLAVGTGLVGAVINGLVALLNQSRTIGSLLGAALFVPQVVVNAALVALCLVGVLVPCAVAVERIGPIQAIQRLVSLLIKRPGGLLLQFGIILYFGGMMLLVLAALACVALGPTLATNGPSMGAMMPSVPTLDMEAEDVSGLFPAEGLQGLTSPPRPWGDWLRHLGLALVFMAVLAFPIVFWICAFARYYESLVPSFEPFTPPTSPPAPPPLPKAGGDPA